MKTLIVILVLVLAGTLYAANKFGDRQAAQYWRYHNRAVRQAKHHRRMAYRYNDRADYWARRARESEQR